MTNKISIVINTYNAEVFLKETLESVKDFDEIVVCDMESTDNTLKIAAEYGCKIVTFEKKNYNICEVARDFAIHSASHEWVLVVDADEIITTELRNYLYDRIKEENCPEALCIARKNTLLGTFMRSSYPDYQLRFLKKDLAYWPPTIHSRPQIKGRIENIPSKREELAMIHLSETMSEMLHKLNEYSDNEVKKRPNKHVSFIKLIFAPYFRFFKTFYLKGGFRHGKIGYIQAKKNAYYKFIILAKMLEAEQKSKNNRQ